jgi:hypothetical protein
MTNLNQETAEELQIANYGIGGHYDPHFDFARVTIENDLKERLQLKIFSKIWNGPAEKTFLTDNNSFKVLNLTIYVAKTQF